MRHLVMPNHVENAKRVVEFVADEISGDTYLDVMAQYQPYYKARTEDFYDEISRPITRDEYEEVVNHARKVGLERLYLDDAMLSRGSGLPGLF